MNPNPKDYLGYKGLPEKVPSLWKRVLESADPGYERTRHPLVGPLLHGLKEYGVQGVAGGLWLSCPGLVSQARAYYLEDPPLLDIVEVPELGGKVVVMTVEETNPYYSGHANLSMTPMLMVAPHPAGDALDFSGPDVRTTPLSESLGGNPQEVMKQLRGLQTIVANTQGSFRVDRLLNVVQSACEAGDGDAKSAMALMADLARSPWLGPASLDGEGWEPYIKALEEYARHRDLEEVRNTTKWEEGGYTLQAYHKLTLPSILWVPPRMMELVLQQVEAGWFPILPHFQGPSRSTVNRAWGDACFVGRKINLQVSENESVEANYKNISKLVSHRVSGYSVHNYESHLPSRFPWAIPEAFFESYRAVVEELLAWEVPDPFEDGWGNWRREQAAATLSLAQRVPVYIWATMNEHAPTPEVVLTTKVKASNVGEGNGAGAQGMAYSISAEVLSELPPVEVTFPWPGAAPKAEGQPDKPEAVKEYHDRPDDPDDVCHACGGRWWDECICDVDEEVEV